VIELTNVTKRYGTGGSVAVDSLSLAVPQGELVVLIGPSGCGKSTTLRMINRLIEPDEGTIELDGVDIRTLPVDELRRGIGYAIQGVGLFPHWTVSRNIATVPALMGWDKARIESRVTELLQLVGLDPDRYSTAYPGELSGGEAQRVGVARALAADPPLLLMDEPFGAVDPITRERLQQQLLDVLAHIDKTVIFVTHDVDEAVRLGDRIAVMRAGRLVQYDVPERVLAYPADDFVAGFLGTERPLKRLSLATVSAVMDRGATTPRDALTIPVDANLRQALSRMLEAGEELVAVVDSAGDTLGVVTLEGLMSHFKKPVG
jgi:osmoprotectant transport system ATP-binding protein